MIKSMLRLVAVTEEPPRKLRMSRGLRRAVRDLKRQAWEEEKRKLASCGVPQNPNICNAWGL
jgi:hypothetical protein